MVDKENLLKQLFLKSGVKSKQKFILENCANGKSILDVGCIGQAIDSESDLWLHGLLCKKFDNVTGVDINEEKIKEVQASGYNVCSVNDLREDQLFDVIVMGDIIEHVSDVNVFLEFYKKHLAPNGAIIITTPNPFSFRQILNVFWFKRPFINIEHTCYLDPYIMIEVLERAGLEFSGFSWISEHAAPKTLTSKINSTITKIMYSIRKYYSPNFGLTCVNKTQK